jgi:flagellar biogenesis protein FliO
MSSFNSLVSILQAVLALIIVVLLANIFLRLLNKNISGSNRMIKIIERVNVSKNSALCIVEICGTHYLMSITEKDNEILKELDKEEVEQYLEDFRAENKTDTIGFTGLTGFTDFKEGLKKRQGLLSNLLIGLRKKD